MAAGRHLGFDPLLDNFHCRSRRKSAGPDRGHLEAGEIEPASRDDDIRGFVGGVRPRPAALGDMDQRFYQPRSGMAFWTAGVSHVRRVESADCRLLHCHSHDYLH